MVRASALWITLASCLVGCSSSPSPEKPVDDGLPETCHPLRPTGVCASPFPASHYLDPDDSTLTGFRLALTADHFPTTEGGAAFAPAYLNVRDGFSPSMPIVASFGVRLDPQSLPPQNAPEVSITEESATLLIDVETGERVLHFAELDAQATEPGQTQALILRPLARLDDAKQYVVVLRRSLAAESGEPLPTPRAWQDEPEPVVLEALDRDGTALDDVHFGWSFTTASRASSTFDLSAMAETTLAMMPEDGFGYAIDAIDEDFSPTVRRRIRGTFTAPRFVSHTDLDVGEISLLRDGSGVPQPEGTYEVPFVLLVPRSATSENPANLVLFGHGFLGTAEQIFGEADDATFYQTFGDSHGHAFIGTDWWGLSQHDVATVVPPVMQDMNRLPWIADRLKQAVVNNLVLARTAKAIASDPAVLADDAFIESTTVDYLGASLGAIMGSVFLAYTPDIERSVLHLGAANWSTLLQRSKLWGALGIFLDPAYRDPFSQLQVIHAFQMTLDDVEPLSRADEIEGPVVVQMGLHDDVVSNVGTAALVRTANLPLMAGAAVTIPGLATVSEPTERALTVWDTGQSPPPQANAANAPTSNNDIHGNLKDVEAVADEIDSFFRTGLAAPQPQ